MKPSPTTSSLLNYAVTRLTPEVFNHPVWIRFGQREAPVGQQTIDDLLGAVKSLQRDDPGAACQILFICAAYQNNTDQQFHAFKTTQQAVSLARSHHLANETLWGLWGACAISTEQGNYEQASRCLANLQEALNRENDWVLADFIEVFRQFLLQGTTSRKFFLAQNIEDQSFSDMMAFTVTWLGQWGLSVEDPGTEFEGFFRQPASQTVSGKVWMQFFLSIRHWRGRWRDLMLAIRGEFKLQWTVHKAEHNKDQVSPWGPIQEELPSQDPNVLRPPNHEVLQTREPVGFSPAQEIILPPVALRDEKSTPFVDEGNKSKPGAVEQEVVVPSIAVHMLGVFSLSIGNTTVKIPASRGLALLKYLLLHHKQHTPREVLMDVFWPDADLDLARNNLNVSMHSLRRALRIVTDLPVVVFEDGAYGLASQLQVWLDVEEFEKCLKKGQQLEARSQLSAAIDEYESAISLYQGDLLEQNPYDEWTILDRERLRIAYLDTLDRLSQIYFQEERYSACRTACQLILIKDPCREDAHCLLMRCYSRQRQPHLALFQYQVCAEALRGELQVEPAPETTDLYNRIRRREQV